MRKCATCAVQSDVLSCLKKHLFESFGKTVRLFLAKELQKFAGTSWCGWRLSSQEFPKLLDCEPGVPHNVVLRDRVHWVVPRDGEDSFPVGHHDVFALAWDSIPGLLQRSNGIEVIDAR